MKTFPKLSFNGHFLQAIRNNGSFRKGFHTSVMCSRSTDAKENCAPMSKFNYQEKINIHIGNDEPLKLFPMWLRHHCRCEKCINYQTHQRNVIPAKLPSISQISDLHITDKKYLHINWNDSHESRFDIQWLNANIQSSRNSKIRRTSFPQQNVEKFKNLRKSLENPLDAAVNYEAFMEEDASVAKLLKNIIEYGYGIVDNSPPDFTSTKNVVRRISHPQMTIFGDFSEWTNNLAHADTAYTSGYVYLHTDTSYFNEPMGLQMFHCLRHDGTGGMNSIADGFNIAKLIYEENANYYQSLSEFVVPYHYKDPENHHFLSHDVIFSHSVLTGELERIRYNPHDLAVINTVPEEELGNFYEALVHLSERIESEPTLIKLGPGLVIFLDNWRTLHGRTEFTGSRHLCGAYIDRSDWQSKARVLQQLN